MGQLTYVNYYPLLPAVCGWTSSFLTVFIVRSNVLTVTLLVVQVQFVTSSVALLASCWQQHFVTQVIDLRLLTDLKSVNTHHENRQHQHNIRQNDEMNTNEQLNLLTGLSLIHKITLQQFWRSVPFDARPDRGSGARPA